MMEKSELHELSLKVNNLKRMNCKKVHSKLIFFVEKELPVSEMEQLRQHLGDCPGCARFAEDMKLTLGILDNDNVRTENPFFFTRVKARLEKQQEEPLESRSVFVRILQPVAFSIVLLLGVYGGFKLGQPAKTELITNVFEESRMVMYLNEMDAEPLETFLME
jgi:hypothetical protein